MRYVVRCGKQALWFPYHRRGRKLALAAARKGGTCRVEDGEGEVLFLCYHKRCWRAR